MMAVIRRAEAILHAWIMMHSSMSAVLTSPAHCGGQSDVLKAGRSSRYTTIDHDVTRVCITVLHIVVPHKDQSSGALKHDSPC